MEKILPPKVGGEFPVDENIIAGMRESYLLVILMLISSALPIPGTKLLTAYHYGSSMWGLTAKLVTELPEGVKRNYMLKVSQNFRFAGRTDFNR